MVQTECSVCGCSVQRQVCVGGVAEIGGEKIFQWRRQDSDGSGCHEASFEPTTQDSERASMPHTGQGSIAVSPFSALPTLVVARSFSGQTPSISAKDKQSRPLDCK